MTWEWLSAQHEGHRLVAARLLMVFLTRLGGGDFRSAIVFSVVVSAVTAAAAIVVARKVRGRSSPCDVFFPLLLLRLDITGFNWGISFVLVLAASLLIGVLLVMVRYGFAAPPSALWGCAVMMALMLGLGGPGLAPLPPLLVWLAGSGLALRREHALAGSGVLLAVVALVGGMAAYLVGFEGSGHAAMSFAQFVVTSVHAFTAPGGCRMADLWPWCGVAASLAIGATAALNLRGVWASGGASRQRALALMLAGVGACGVLLAIGYGRGNVAWSGCLEVHYLSLALPLACWMYLVWDRCGTRLRLPATCVLSGLSVVTYAGGALHGRKLASIVGDKTKAFQQAACAGMPADDLAIAHNAIVFHIDLSASAAARTSVVCSIEHMRERGFGLLSCK